MRWRQIRLSREPPIEGQTIDVGYVERGVYHTPLVHAPITLPQYSPVPVHGCAIAVCHYCIQACTPVLTRPYLEASIQHSSSGRSAVAR